MERTLILGGPGCGKTSRLMDVIDQCVRDGIPHDRIAFCSFTKTASNNGRRRALDKFNIPDEKGVLPFFRTLHSLCFTQMGTMRSRVIGPDHYKEIQKLAGRRLDLEGYKFDLSHFDVEEHAFASIEANPLITIDHFARTTDRSLYDAWQLQSRGVPWRTQEQFSAMYKLFKDDHGILDFTDMLIDFKEKGDVVPVDIAILDEVQDLTPLQWDVVNVAFANVKKMYAAGDDDQSIYDWAGADSSKMLNLEREGWKVEHLVFSHRLTRKAFALSQTHIKGVKRRYDKPTRPTEKEGTLELVRGLHQFDWSTETGTWLMLARTKHQLDRVIAEAQRRGYHYSVNGTSRVSQKHMAAIDKYVQLQKGEPLRGEEISSLFKYLRRHAKLEPEDLYSIHDLKWDANEPWFVAFKGIGERTREYYRACRRNGEALKGVEARVRISTIHSAKGMEAPNVMVMTDLTPKTWEGMRKDADPEYRALYVGMTRASSRLVLLMDQSIYRFPLPLSMIKRL